VGAAVGGVMGCGVLVEVQAASARTQPAARSSEMAVRRNEADGFTAIVSTHFTLNLIKK